MSNNTTADVTGIFSLDANRLVGLAAKGSPDVTYLAGQDTPTSGIPLTATLSDEGIVFQGGAASFSPSDIVGKIPDDVQVMWYRKSGKSINFSVPNPYAAINGFVTHPGILYVPNGFAGYKYWLAYTPMPKINGTYDAKKENPCIAASNDLYNWVLPQGAPNPIAEAPTEGAYSYNSDTHLILHPDGTRLVMIWRPRLDGGALQSNTIMLSTSVNGSAWSAPIEIWRGDVPTDKRLMASPSLCWNPSTSKWEIFAHHHDGALYKFHKITSSSLEIGWDPVPTLCNFPAPAGRQWWHSSVFRLASGRYVGVVQDNNGSSGNTGRVYLLQSMDGLNFEYALIDAGSTADGDLYRPSAFFVERGGNVEMTLIKSYLDKSYYTAELMSYIPSQTTAAADNIAFYCSVSAAASGFKGAVLAADDFNRADGAIGSTLNGLTWANQDANLVTVSSNRATADTTGQARALVTLSTPNYSAFAQLAESGKSAFLVFNWVDANNFWRFGMDNGAWQVTQIAAGLTVPATSKYGTTGAAGDICRVDVSGRSFRAYLNGALFHALDGVLSPGSATVGMRLGGSTTGSIENFAAIALQP